MNISVFEDLNVQGHATIATVSGRVEVAGGAQAGDGLAADGQVQLTADGDLALDLAETSPSEAQAALRAVRFTGTERSGTRQLRLTLESDSGATLSTDYNITEPFEPSIELAANPSPDSMDYCDGAQQVVPAMGAGFELFNPTRPFWIEAGSQLSAKVKITEGKRLGD